MNILLQDVSDDGRGTWDVIQGMGREPLLLAVRCATATKCVIIMGDRDKRMATRRTACTA